MSLLKPVTSDVSITNLTVYLGLQSQQGLNPNEVLKKVTQIILHPSYNPSTFDHDVCLLRLSSSVSFTEYIRPACLAAEDSSFYDGIDSYVTGWGAIRAEVSLPFPQTLQEVSVPVVGNRKCNCLYGVGSITNNMICAGLLAGGKDSCQGDSGGPMVRKQGTRWVQSGVVSFGIGCAQANYPGVYARVSQYQTWINSQITSNQPGFITFSSSGTDSDLSVTCTGLPALLTSAPPTTTTPKFVECGSAPINSPVGEGSSTSAGAWPWMASLQRNGSHVCGGTLVAQDFVMSDASCFTSQPSGSDWTVILGRLKQNGSNPFEVRLNVENVTLSNLTGDNVAILRLSTNVTLNDYVQPICLDTGNQNITTGSECWVAGWGLGEGGSEQVLQQFQTSVVDCVNASSSDICIAAVTLHQSDRGGPLMCQQGGLWTQAAALTVDSSNDASTSSKILRSLPMIFTKTSSFESFLLETLSRSVSPAAITTSSSKTTNVTTTANSTNSVPNSINADLISSGFA
ncbi:transmembrane protease serine 9-like [Aplochiton taeniatus]